MANRQRGEIGFTADGQDYTLRFSTNALVQIEDKYEVGALKYLARLDAWGEDSSAINFKEIRFLFWAGLQDFHEGVTEQQAGFIMGAVGPIDAALSLLTEAISSQFPSNEGAVDESEGKPAATTVN